MRSRFVCLGPLRRAAGERKGPIAQRWVGEVVSITTAMCEWRGTMTHLTSPALTARVPFLSPRYAGGEDL
jgi:hypothetical protein